jgi:uncharacterized membrane protein YvlD (DUF360 family)
MNGNDIMGIGLFLFVINAILLTICVVAARWSRNFQFRWLQVVGLIGFGLGSLLFGACTLFWGWSWLANFI